MMSGVFQPLNENLVAGSALICDIYGNNALVLRIIEPREIYRQGVNTTVQVILIFLAGGLFLGLGVILLLDHVVLKRIESLALQVHEIGQSGHFDHPVFVEGDDELSGLALEMNRMLNTIEQVQVSETWFRELAEPQPLVIFEMDLTGDLNYVNKTGVELFRINEEMIQAGINIRRYVSAENFEQMHHVLSVVMSGAKSPGEIYSLRQLNGELM